ncbi:MAG: T9SS type A sorting domain-containing protein [Chitinophagaceae bacterium]|nr:T9SS type A sorting domain-containing protein [Chitinophagaceae bacterium]
MMTDARLSLLFTCKKCANGCYCVSNPTSNDGNGISNVQIGTTNFPTGDVTYFDHTATVVDLARGINSNVQVTFQTGFTYNTNIWIDFNDNFVFEASELVYQGESLATNPTTLNASFVMPLSAPLGQHRMRIGTADSGQVPPNPCYSGSWGVTLDFTVNIIQASCTPATVASSSVVADCANNQYSINVDVTSLGNGTPVITDGTNNWPVTSTGVTTVGPFANATSVTLTLLHGSDAACNVSLGNFNNICPPTNDTCATAIPVNCSDVVAGSTSNGATNTGGNAAADVWYSYSGEAGDITLSLCTNTTFDTFIRVFDACEGTQIAFNDDTCGLQSSVTFAANGTSTYYIMVEGFGTATGNFELTVSCVLNTDSFNNNNFSAYPNPVKDILNLAYTSEISDVRVVNMLGQVVLTKKLNANNGQLDVSQLSAGTYIVNVTIGDTVKTIKVVKQ